MTCSMRWLIASMILAMTSGFGWSGSLRLGAVAEAADCAKGQGDLCWGECPVKLGHPWEGARCVGGARATSGSRQADPHFVQEGRCAIGAHDFLGAWKCIIQNGSIPIQGCDVSLRDVPGSVKCIADKVKDAATKAYDDAKNAVLGQSVDILGCKATLGNIPGTFECLKNETTRRVNEAVASAKAEISKGVNAVGGGLLTLLEKAQPFLECAGVNDVVRMVQGFFANPLKFFLDGFGKVGALLKAGWDDIAAAGERMLTDVLGSLSGTEISDESISKLMDFMWTTTKRLATISTPFRCALDFLEPLKEKLAAPTRSALRLLLDLIPMLQAWAKKTIGEKLVPKLGELLLRIDQNKWLNSLRRIVTAAFDPTKRMKEAASRLNTVFAAIREKSPNLETTWKNARAAITSSADFGVREALLIAQLFVKEVVSELLEIAARELGDVAEKIANIGGPTVLNRAVDGVCGFVPEVGAAICTVLVSGVLRLGWTIFGSTAFRKVVLPLMQLLTPPILDQVVYLVQSQITNHLDPALANKASKAGLAASIVQPIVALVIRTIQDVAVPGSYQVMTYNNKVAELGDIAVALALGKKAPAALTATSAKPASWLKPIPPPAPPKPTVAARPAAAAADGALQFGWRWCDRCKALVFSGLGAKPCPTGGAHNHAGGNYGLASATSGNGGQRDWRWCDKCAGLVFAGVGKKPCAGGGVHTHPGGEYSVHNKPVAGQQNNWRWCAKCSSLWFAGAGAGACAGGGSHNAGGTDYNLRSK